MYVAPTGQAVLNRNSTAHVLCVRCGLEHIRDDDDPQARDQGSRQR